MSHEQTILRRLELSLADDVLAQAVSKELHARRGSIFQTSGLEAIHATVTRLLAAFCKDLEEGGTAQLRMNLRDCVRGLSAGPLVFRDLRVLVTSLRSALLTALAPQLGADELRKVEDWCLELSLQCALLLIAWREEIIDQQAKELEARLAEQRQLSIPIAPVYPGVLMVPLVGTLDSYRAEVLTERVLREITNAGAHFLLLDISGVPKFDREIASNLLKVMQATRMLGTEMVLVGISAEMAQIIVTLDVQLNQLVTLRSMQDGLAYALGRLGRQIVPVTTTGTRSAAPRSSADLMKKPRGSR